MARSAAESGASNVGSTRVLRTRKPVAPPAKVDNEESDSSASVSRKRGRRTLRGRGKKAVESDPEPQAAADEENDEEAPNKNLRGAKRQTTAAKKKDESNSEDAKEDDEESALLASVSRDTRTFTSKRKRERGTILAEFASLDALLSNDLEEKKRKAVRADKLERLREEAKSVSKRGGRLSLDASPLAKMMSDISHNITSLSADNHLFPGDSQPLRTHEEKYGFVFTPIAEPLAYQPFKATPSELQSDLGIVYKAMQTTNEEELGALLWSKAILLRALLGSEQAKKKHKSSPSMSPVQQPVVLPERICSWLFVTMSMHSNSHIVRGCLSNLFALMGSSIHLSITELKSGLPYASFCQSVQGFRTSLGDALPDLQMQWRPTIYDFVGAFRRFGFQDSKRSMSARSKIAATKKPPTTQQRADSSINKASVPFPTLNMLYVLAFLVLSLRTKLLRPDGYDAMSFTMFFLRMQFEHNMHPEIVQLATICIEELLETFPTAEWRKEWGASLVMRIAGANEGLFDSASGWLTVARRLPRTKRGTQLTTGLAVYVLQHRIDKAPDDVASKSERPLKFPIQSGLVLDIVAGIVEDLTAKYTEKKKQESNTDKAGAARLPPPPFDLLCKKVALMDLALQAFLNELTFKEMSVLLGKLDDLASSHKSTMSAKWHELKTLVGLMRRKYSLENLRVGRTDAPSPRAKAVLFVDDDGQQEAEIVKDE